MNEPMQTNAGATSDPGKRAGAHAQEARGVAAEKAQEVKNEVKRSAEEIGAQAREAVEQVKHEASHMAEEAKARGRQIFDDRKQQVASQIQACSSAARDAANRLRNESDTNLSSYVDSAADFLDRMGNRIAERPMNELLDDVRLGARRRPEVFFGGMFVAGLAAARFLKATSHRRPSASHQFPSTHQASDPAYHESLHSGAAVSPGAPPAVSSDPDVVTPASPQRTGTEPPSAASLGGGGMAPLPETPGTSTQPQHKL